MKKVLILVVLALIVAATTQPAAAIVGGVLDGETHPNVGLMIADIDGEPVWRCTGTLIAPTVFLTAGHCTGDGATGARVWFESDMTANPEYPYAGETSYEGTPVTHPLFLWAGSDKHDVGVVILDEPVEGIVPATLPEPDFLSLLKKQRLLVGGSGQGVMFRSVGYGGSLASWPPPELTYVRVRQWSESEYVSLTQNTLHLFQRAVFDESGSCFGDSGGPVFYVDPVDGSEIVVAVTSSGDAMCVAAGFNYRIDTAEILAWVKSQIP